MIRALVFLFLGITAAGAVVNGAVERRSRHAWLALHEQVAARALDGDLEGLLEARLAAARARAAAPKVPELAAAVGLWNAWLAADYGLATTEPATDALARAEDMAASSQHASVAVGRGFLALAEGDVGTAHRIAVDLGRRYPRDPRPFLLLGRARARLGDLDAAAHAFAAAQVLAPESAGPLVDWAEVELDANRTAAVAETLREALRRRPNSLRARLLLERLGTVEPQNGDRPPQRVRESLAACDNARGISPVLDAQCALAAATRARLGGNRAEARTKLQELASTGPLRPQAQAMMALLLAELGEIDAAAALLRDLVEAGRPELPLPALSWARVAVTLGQGGAPPVRLPDPTAHPDVRLVAARATWALGPEALEMLLASWPKLAIDRDPDLRQYASLADPTITARLAPPANQTPDPITAYVEGQRAKRAGDAPSAARWLTFALTGHGETCRAAFDLVDAQALVHQPPPPTVTQHLAQNQACQTLDPTSPDSQLLGPLLTADLTAPP